MSMTRVNGQLQHLKHPQQSQLPPPQGSRNIDPTNANLQNHNNSSRKNILQSVQHQTAPHLIYNNNQRQHTTQTTTKSAPPTQYQPSPFNSMNSVAAMNVSVSTPVLSPHDHQSPPHPSVIYHSLPPASSHSHTGGLEPQ